MTDKHLQFNHGLARSTGKPFVREAALAGNRSIQACARLLWAIALLSGGAIVASPQTAWANAVSESPIPQTLIAQDIVEGLPPPPNVSGQVPIPRSERGLPPSQSLPDATPPQATQPQLLQPVRAGDRYAVVINSNSPRLLEQVQRVASSATLQEYQGLQVIQVDTFNDADRAERQVQLLASRGIGAKIVSLSENALAASSQVAQVQRRAPSSDLPPPDLLPAQPVPREVEFGGGQSTLDSFPSPPSLPTDSSGTSNERSSDREAARSSSTAALPDRSSDRSSRAYYVVIPGKQGELDAISNQVIRLGEGFGIAQLVQQSGAPRGPHVQVGPFADRDAANRWNRFFRDFGMDARIFVDR